MLNFTGGPSLGLQAHSWITLNLEIGLLLAWCQDLRPSQNNTHLAYTSCSRRLTPILLGPRLFTLEKSFPHVLGYNIALAVYVLVLSLQGRQGSQLPHQGPNPHPRTGRWSPDCWITGESLGPAFVIPAGTPGLGGAPLAGRPWLPPAPALRRYLWAPHLIVLLQQHRVGEALVQAQREKPGRCA